jgi:hypothetical protein
MIKALTSAPGNFFKTFSCTARAPWSRHKGHVGESNAKNLILPLSALNCALSGSRERSRVIIFFNWFSIIILNTFQSSKFQLITSNGVIPGNPSTTWRTSPKHHLPLGFFSVHWQFPSHRSCRVPGFCRAGLCLQPTTRSSSCTKPSSRPSSSRISIDRQYFILSGFSLDRSCSS